jgi:hypothetical protein
VRAVSLPDQASTDKDNVLLVKKPAHFGGGFCRTAQHVFYVNVCVFYVCYVYYVCYITDPIHMHYPAGYYTFCTQSPSLHAFILFPLLASFDAHCKHWDRDWDQARQAEAVQVPTIALP